MTADVIAALIKLNSHARAYGCGKHAIYAYKTLVAAQLIAANEATVFLRQWTGQCDHCRGTGRYVDSYGERWPHCRRCASTGRVTLKFVETELLGGPTWHCPFDANGDGRHLAALAGAAMWDGEKGRWTNRDGNEPIFWNVANGWTPKQRGEQLTPDDAALALNTVEAWVLTLDVLPHATPYWLLTAAKREMRGYHLDVGRIGLTCWYCGRPDIVTGFCRSGPPFTWCAPVCAEHEKMPVSLWPAKEALPDWVLTPPLMEWRERHARMGFVPRDY